MENKYFNHLDATISFREHLRKIEEEKAKMLEVIEDNMNECNHEVLITFGHKKDYRCYGVGEKYYCPFCSKIIIKYLRDGNINENYNLIVDLRDLNIDNDKVGIVFLEIQKSLHEYLNSNKNANVIEIKEYINSLNVRELLPKVKKLK